MNQSQEWKNTLSYIQSELNRIETMAGTLSMIEQEHYQRLTNFEQRELAEMAVEEQNAARQLGAIKHMCLAMAQKIEQMNKSLDRGESGESAERAETH